MEISLRDKAKKAPKRKRAVEESGEMAKRRSARVRNTKSKKEEKIDFQELLFKYLPPRCLELNPTHSLNLKRVPFYFILYYCLF